MSDSFTVLNEAGKADYVADLNNSGMIKSIFQCYLQDIANKSPIAANKAKIKQFSRKSQTARLVNVLNHLA